MDGITHGRVHEPKDAMKIDGPKLDEVPGLDLHDILQLLECFDLTLNAIGMCVQEFQ